MNPRAESVKAVVDAVVDAHKADAYVDLDEQEKALQIFLQVIR